MVIKASQVNPIVDQRERAIELAVVAEIMNADHVGLDLMKIARRAVDLETGSTRMIEATTVDAASTIALLMAIVSMYPTKRLILDPQPLLRDLERLWTIRSEIPARGGAEKLGHSKKIYDRAVSPIKTDFCQAATSAKYFTLRGSFI